MNAWFRSFLASWLFMAGFCFASDVPGEMIKITESNYNEVIASSQGVVVDVYASWCGPCKTMEPIFQRLFKTYGSQCQFAKLSTEEVYSLAQKLHVRSIPTFIFFRNGKEVGRVIGQRSYEQLSADLAQYFQLKTD